MRSSFLLILSMLILSTPLSSAYKFEVGGKDGWTVKASGRYDVWASRIKFLVNDTLSKNNLIFLSYFFISKYQNFIYIIINNSIDFFSL